MRSLFALADLASRLLVSLVAEATSPPTCAACDAKLPRGVAFCAPCASTVVRRGLADLEDDGPIAFGAYGGALATAIGRFKFDDRPDLARPLGHLLRAAAREACLEADLVVPVPLHPRKLADRGYNQAALLAAAIAEELCAPHAARALVRVRNTSQQAKLGREARVANVEAAFRVRDERALRGRRVVLVDDVASTGSTLAACKTTLLAAGAAEVTCLVVARAELGIAAFSRRSAA